MSTSGANVLAAQKLGRYLTAYRRAFKPVSGGASEALTELEHLLFGSARCLSKVYQ